MLLPICATTMASMPCVMDMLPSISQGPQKCKEALLFGLLPNFQPGLLEAVAKGLCILMIPRVLAEYQHISMRPLCKTCYDSTPYLQLIQCLACVTAFPQCMADDDEMLCALCFVPGLHSWGGLSLKKGGGSSTTPLVLPPEGGFYHPPPKKNGG